MLYEYYRLRVSVGGIINYYNVVHMLGIKRYAFESRRGLIWESSKCCKNISAIIPDKGDPMATPLSGW